MLAIGASVLPLNTEKKLFEAMTHPNFSLPTDIYSVKYTYQFENAEQMTEMLRQIENEKVIFQINDKYALSGKILDFKHSVSGTNIENLYIFDNEQSYMRWEEEMVLARVMDHDHCNVMTIKLNRNAKNFNEECHKEFFIPVRDV